MTTIAPARAAFSPPIPQTLQDLAIPDGIVLDLMLRRLLLEGYTTLQALSGRLNLSTAVLSIVFQHMRQQQLIEVKGMVGNDYSFSLSAAGRSLASERFQLSQYAGPCPVALRDYGMAVLAQAAAVTVSREKLKHAYADMVLPDETLDRIGPALVSQKSVFLYGPTGNGKTSIAERMLRVYEDAVLIPHAIEVDGQIIGVYDPVVHRCIEQQDPSIDPRWVLCRRPCLIVGGELVPQMLELRFDEISGIYAAPLQMKANNGIFIIDDFGRQMMAPRELLNRWIVPLDRRVDYLSLRYGVKFQIPFELMVVFSTNLEPSELADEAFLRRIRNKILIDAVSPAVFDLIFMRVMQRRGHTCAPGMAEFVRELCLREGRTGLRACYPNDLCDIVESISNYEERPPEISAATLVRAAALYFAKN